MKNRRQDARRMDAQVQYFFDQQLEKMLEEIDVVYPENKAQLIIPVAPAEGPGVKSLKYRMKDRVGRAKIIAGNSRDLPRVDVVKSEFPWPVKMCGASFGYAIDEVEAAAYAQEPLERDRAQAAQEAIEEEINRIAFFGESSVGIEGFLNNSNISAANVPSDGDGNSPSFDDKDPEQIVRDVNEMVKTIVSTTKGTEFATAIMFPTTVYKDLASTPMSAHNNMTILNFLKQANPEVTLWDWLNELEEAGSSDSRRMVAFRRDPRKVQMHVPVGFTMRPEQYVGLEVEVPCYAYTAGTMIKFPKSMVYRDQI